MCYKVNFAGLLSDAPLCFQITFNNRAHSGKIKVYFNSDTDIQECKDWHILGSVLQKNSLYILVFDGFVILNCLASLILCSRSVVLALRLRQRFVNFFLEKYNRCVSYTDRMEFINGWYVLVIISDVMTIIGSILKMEIKAKMRGALGKVLDSLESSVMCFNLDK